jgi:YgiT-type zinc finger domain-containing protein
MKCVICKQANVEPGTATVTLERGGMTLVVKHVLARVCPNCGEEYVDEAAAVKLMETAEQAAQSGVQVDVRDYASAA